MTESTIERKKPEEREPDNEVRVIDAHHHLWRYNPEEYGWIDGSMEVLQRDFLPEDMRPLLEATGVEGTVAVQARQTLEETRWLLELADAHEAIRGVVGWAPLASEGFAASIEVMADRPKLKGLRHVIHDEPDENFILREDFNAGVTRLREYGLVYDILVFARHLPQTIEFVDRHPDQAFVLDHIAKPEIAAGVLEPWASRMKELARRENVLCKLSGLVTEADWVRWTPEGLKPYLDTVVEAFGPGRVMVGSDWPVCLVASSYPRWFEVLRGYFAEYSADERARIFCGTAVDAYRLG